MMMMMMMMMMTPANKILYQLFRSVHDHDHDHVRSSAQRPRRRASTSRARRSNSQTPIARSTRDAGSSIGARSRSQQQSGRQVAADLEGCTVVLTAGWPLDEQRCTIVDLQAALCGGRGGVAPPTGGATPVVKKEGSGRTIPFIRIQKFLGPVESNVVDAVVFNRPIRGSNLVYGNQVIQTYIPGGGWGGEMGG